MAQSDMSMSSRATQLFLASVCRLHLSLYLDCIELSVTLSLPRPPLGFEKQDLLSDCKVVSLLDVCPPLLDRQIEAIEVW